MNARRLRVGSAVDSSSNSKHLYDKASRLQFVKSGQTVALYGYLPNSPLVGSITFWQNGQVRLDTRKQYDFLNRLTSVVNTPGGTNQPPVAFNYSYNNANQRTAVTNADNSRWAYQYDPLGQVISGRKYWSDGTAVAGQQFEYAFDDIGNRTSSSAGGDAAGGNLRVSSYSVNSLNQYTSRTVPGAVDILGAATNAATVTVNGQPAYRKGEYYRQELAFDNNSAAVYASVTNMATLDSVSVTNTGSVFLPRSPEAFAYDLDGNLTNDGRWSYSWDAENRLVAMGANTPAVPQISLKFDYDAQGRRTRKQVWPNGTWSGAPTNDVRFVYDGWNLLATLNSQLATLNFFVWGLDLSGSLQGAGGVGGLLCVSEISNGQIANSHFTAYDGNGNVTALVNAGDGTVSARYEYGPFGEALRATGPMAKRNSFRFSTKWVDDDTGLFYYGYRYYNPSTGRWINQDPIQELGGPNFYNFANNDGLNSADLLGLIIAADCDLKKYLSENSVKAFSEQTSGSQKIYTGNARYDSSDIVSEILGTMINSPRNFQVANQSELQSHVTARIEAVKYAKQSKFSFATAVQGNFMPEQYWDFEFIRMKVDGVDTRVKIYTGLKKGLSLEDQKAAYALLQGSAAYKIACKQALEAAIKAGAVNAGVSGARIMYKEGLPDGDWVPGDWGYVANTGVRDKNAGTSGENILYVGGGKYWGHWLSIGEKYPDLDALNAARILPLKAWETSVDEFDGTMDNSFELKNYRKYTGAGLK